MNAEITVAPGLLIAMPQLADPNFHRSVVLMVKHGRDGSFGLIINRQMEQKVSELLTPLEIDWQGSRADLAWWGGPVEQGTGWLLARAGGGLRVRVDGRDRAGNSSVVGTRRS